MLDRVILVYGKSAKEDPSNLEAREWYRESADTSLRLPNRAAVSPQRFIYHKPAEATRAILACDAALRNLAQSTL